jgi:hypothetical protein
MRRTGRDDGRRREGPWRRAATVGLLVGTISPAACATTPNRPTACEGVQIR